MVECGLLQLANHLSPSLQLRQPQARYLMTWLASLLAPGQLGYAVKGGAE